MTTTEPVSDAAKSSDADLIRAVRSGDAGAYGVLYQRHAAAAQCLALQFLRSAADADDVVAEAFTRVLGVISKGGGPAIAFRPYLLGAVRHIACDQLRRQHSQIPTDEVPDRGELPADPAMASLERSLVRSALMSLPERWIAVLWHTEIEQSKPAEVALLLGLTPNGVAALSYRAREALRQAYLQMHLSGATRAECTPVARQLGAHVRGALSRRASRRVDGHLRRCDDCSGAYAELVSINGALRGLLAPLILGSGAAAYLAARAGQGATAAAAAAHRATAGTTAAGATAHHAAAGATAHHAAAAGHAAAAAAGHGTAAAGTAAAGAASHAMLAASMAARAALRWLKMAGLSSAAVPAAAGVIVAAIAIPAATLSHHHSAGTQSSLAGPGSSHVTGRPVSSSSAPPRSRVPGTSRSPLTVSPSPVKSPGHSPGSTPTPVPTPTPTGQSPTPGGPSPTPAPDSSPPSQSAALSVAISLHGHMKVGVVTVAHLMVRDRGTGTTGDLTAHIILPGGISYVGISGPGQAWSCAASQQGAICTHGPIVAGGSAPAAIKIVLADTSGCGSPVLATVVSGKLSASAQSAPISCKPGRH